MARGAEVAASMMCALLAGESRTIAP